MLVGYLWAWVSTIWVSSGSQWPQLNNHCNMQVFCTVMCGKLSLEMNYISSASVLLMFCEVASLNCVLCFVLR